MGRLTKKKPEELTPEQREQFDRLTRMRKPDDEGQIGGPFDVWIRSPELARRAVSLGNFIWERTTLDRGLVELGIIVTARFWRSNVEWVAHAGMAAEFGISQAIIDDVFAERRPGEASVEELLVYDVSHALHDTHELPLELYEQAVEAFGEQGLVELIMAIGFYTFVSMSLNAFDVDLAPGVEAPFPSS